jgi:hypothetical protein
MDDSNARWRELYHAALLELDRDSLLAYVELAERAIRAQRSLDQPRHQPDNHTAERDAMEDALHALSLLRRTALED